MILANSVLGEYPVENSNVSINRMQNAPDLSTTPDYVAHDSCPRILSTTPDYVAHDSCPPAQHMSTSAPDYMNLKSACEKADLNILIKSEMNYIDMCRGDWHPLAKRARYLRPVREDDSMKPLEF